MSTQSIGKPGDVIASRRGARSGGCSRTVSHHRPSIAVRRVERFSSTCAPASTARWNVSSASSTYTYRKAGNGSRSAVDEIMMTESPMWISAGRPGSMSPVAANTSRRKWTCAATSSTTTRGVTDRYPARGSLPGTPQSPTAQWWETRSTTRLPTSHSVGVRGRYQASLAPRHDGTVRPWPNDVLRPSSR